MNERRNISRAAKKFKPLYTGANFRPMRILCRIHVKRCGKWVADYLAKYLSKEVRAGCLKGKRLWATFGDATWTRVKDIVVRSWR